MFATPDGAIEIAVQSHKSKAVALVKWLTKRVQRKYTNNTNKTMKREMQH